ncbi:Retrovirus-related Pol polyprotein from transposon 412 [Vitis vinifera]|uniref:Retrovirus-related Pol polyprotein from transposon 412 n=1 Tax=Vitis vinifera TaxID=29760 RepID=A0A438DZQ6_VITVI|nr:Retrovirus-related Pol polyprotein from transposon 412 [Vitis vinifera]
MTVTPLEWVLGRDRVALQASSLLRKGCQGFLAYVVNEENDLKLESIPIVWNYPDVFPDDLPSLPPERQSLFLGHMVTKDGISVDPRKFIERFSKIVLPLTRLTQKGVKFEWSNDCKHSFQELKNILVTTPILTIPSGSGGFMVYSDASRQGLGCVLMQNGKVVVYASK